jgi:hypothetical protein
MLSTPPLGSIVAAIMMVLPTGLWPVAAQDATPAAAPAAFVWQTGRPGLVW